MTTTNRSALIAKVHKVLKKHYKPVHPPAERTVLEHLLYACCLENARYEAADEAFARLQELYFDWNEIRVTTVSELAEVMAGIPDGASAGQRIKKALQSVFESAYSFDIEALRKQNLGKAEKDLERIGGTTPFVRAYVAQNGLEGHSIPVSQGGIEVLYAVGVISEQEADKRQVPGLERAIPKNKGVEFGSLLQQIAADFYASPGSSKLRGILAEIDEDYKERLSQRTAKLEEASAKAAADKQRSQSRSGRMSEMRPSSPHAAKESPSASRHEAKESPHKPSAKAPPEKPAAEAAGKGKGKEKPTPPPAAKKKDEPADKPDKKMASKGLAKKKPR